MLFSENKYSQLKKIRHVIVHVHIFKNAGSTFDSILEKNFGQDFLDHRDDQIMIKGGGEYLKHILQERPNLKAISSHHIYFNPKEAETDAIKILPVYFLRHPLERVLSVYKYEKKQPLLTPGAIQAKKLNINDYVLWRMQPNVGGTIRNMNTRYCSGLSNQASINDLSFELAKKNLNDSQFVGIVDRFDDSIRLFRDPLQARFPFMTLQYVPQNVGQEINKTLEERIEELKKQLEENTWDLLCRENSFDLMLDSFVRNLFEKRLKTTQCL